MTETKEIVFKLHRWANARERRNPFGHGKTGTALLRQAALRLEQLDQTARLLERDLNEVERYGPHDER